MNVNKRDVRRGDIIWAVKSSDPDRKPRPFLVSENRLLRKCHWWGSGPAECFTGWYLTSKADRLYLGEFIVPANRQTGLRVDSKADASRGEDTCLTAGSNVVELLGRFPV